MGGLLVTSITHAATIPLRHLVLRAGKDVSTCHWPGDTDPTTQHYGAKTDGDIVGIGSLYLAEHDCAPAPPDGAPDPNVWQLRGMAVHPDHRGHNIGRQLLAHMMDDARNRLRAKTIWCNARIRATGLYERAGFDFASDVFEIEGIGPHRVMRLRLA